jgi:enterobactin synthetase component D
MKTDIEQFLVSRDWFNQISEDNVSIYHCEFAKDHYKDSLFGELAVVYSDTLDRAVPKRKAEYLAGRFCAKQALAKHSIENFVIKSDKNRAPLWPDGIKGAITHSNHNALVAVNNSPDVLGIGIDVESVMTDKTMNDVKEAIVKGDENRFLDMSPSIPGTTAGTVVSLIFSIKESFFKAAYPSTGFYFDFDAVTVTVLDFDKKIFSLTVNQDLNPKIRPGMQYSGQFCFVGEQVLSLLVLR